MDTITAPDCCCAGGTTPVSDCNTNCHVPLRALNCLWTYTSLAGGTNSIHVVLNHFPASPLAFATWFSDAFPLPVDYQGARGATCGSPIPGPNCYVTVTMNCLSAGGFQLTAIVGNGPGGVCTNLCVEWGAGTAGGHPLGPDSVLCGATYAMTFQQANGPSVDIFDLS